MSASMWRIAVASLASLCGLILCQHAATALDVSNSVAGTWNDTVLRLRIGQSNATSLQGEIDQSWIDAGGHRQEGKASFIGTRYSDDFEIFLVPSSLVTLPIRLYGRLSDGEVMLKSEGINDPGSEVPLTRANAVDYDALIDKLTPVPMDDGLPSAPVNFLVADARRAIQDDMEAGCQCGPAKKARVGEVTLQLASDVARHTAEFNDYLRGLKASWREMNESLREIGATHGTAVVMTGKPEGEDYTRRLVMGRDSIAAYNDVFGAFRDAQLLELKDLQKQCQQRNLPMPAAVTAEERIWANSCEWVDRIQRAYIAAGENFGDTISLPTSPALYFVFK